MKFGYFTLSDNAYRDNPRPANRFIADIIDEAVYAEQVGLNSAWLGEHHFSTLGVLSCPDLALAYIAARTNRIRLAPAVSVLPLHNPIRDLHVRPVYHWLADRVRAHVFLCMLAYYLEWHMRQRLAPMLFDDTDKEAAEAQRSSVVAQAQRSKAAIKKQTTGLTVDGLAVHSFRTLLLDLATLARNTMTTAINPDHPLTVLTRPTPIQQRAFDLLGVAV